MKDQDLLSHLLKNLASVAGTINEGNLSGLLNGSSKLQLQNFVASRGQVRNFTRVENSWIVYPTNITFYL